MKLLYKMTLLIALSVLLFIIGCSDRGVNDDNDTELSEGTELPKTGSHVYTNELTFQIQNKFQQMKVVGYWPKIAFEIQAGGEFKPVPMLVLLPPQDADENFFFGHGLKAIADEMISKGEIQPMAILCVPNDPIFGGYFFAGSSPSAGFYDSLIGDELIRFVEEEFFVTTLRTKQKRAIGGFGMGAYGAFRAAMLHPDKFGSVSGVSGPMDFDGADGNSGFVPLFAEALAEQNITGLDLPSNYNLDNRTGKWHLSRLFVGGGFAFTPHDTLLYFSDTSTFNGNTGTFTTTYTLDSLESLDTLVFPSSSRISFPGISQSEHIAADLLYSFYLPFDNSGNPVPVVWDMWLNNNLPNILAANPTAFNGVNLWIANSSESTFGNYYEQTNSWVSTLNAANSPSTPISLTVYNYTGYDGHPANKDQYMYDLLREMLIFHSENFGN